MDDIKNGNKFVRNGISCVCVLSYKEAVIH